MTEGVIGCVVPTPYPLPYGKCVKEDGLAVREGEDYSIHLISKGDFIPL